MEAASEPEPVAVPHACLLRERRKFANLLAFDAEVIADLRARLHGALRSNERLRHCLGKCLALGPSALTAAELPAPCRLHTAGRRGARLRS